MRYADPPLDQLATYGFYELDTSELSPEELEALARDTVPLRVGQRIKDADDERIATAGRISRFGRAMTFPFWRK